MAIGNWTDEVLCTNGDLQSLESGVLEWTRSEGGADKWIDEAKSQIEHELRQYFKDVDQLINASVDAGDDRTDVLDLVPDYDALKYAACYLTLHLICNNASSAAGDYFDRKAEMYWHKYQKEIPSGLSMLSVDIDESEAIAESERGYFLDKSARFTR